MAPVDFEKQPVLCPEMVGHAAGICASGLRNVANRHRVKAVCRKQLFRGAQDRLAQIRLARGRFIVGGWADHDLYKCTNHTVKSTNMLYAIQMREGAQRAYLAFAGAWTCQIRASVRRSGSSRSTGRDSLHRKHGKQNIKRNRTATPKGR